MQDPTTQDATSLLQRRDDARRQLENAHRQLRDWKPGAGVSFRQAEECLRLATREWEEADFAAKRVSPRRTPASAFDPVLNWARFNRELRQRTG